MKEPRTCGPLDVLLDQSLSQSPVHGGGLDLWMVPPVGPVHGSGREIKKKVELKKKK